MNTQGMDFFSSEVTHQSESVEIKLTTEPILGEVEKLNSLLAERNDLHTVGYSEATGSRRDDTPASSSDKRYDVNVFLC